MEGGAARRVDGARGSEALQDRVDVAKGKPLVWICAFFQWCLLERPHFLGHWASMGRAMAQEAGVASSSPYQPRSPGHCSPAPGPGDLEARVAVGGCLRYCGP